MKRKYFFADWHQETQPPQYLGVTEEVDVSLGFNTPLLVKADERGGSLPFCTALKFSRTKW
jgi:hypothetical protein